MEFYISLQEMLESREQRVERQKALIDTYQLSLICFTLNIPGDKKDFPAARLGFATGYQAILTKLREENIPIIAKEQSCDTSGSTGFVVFDTNPFIVKRWMRELEEAHPLGRLFDIDVLQTNYQKIAGEELGYSPRRCFLCDKNAFLCARNRTHRPEEIAQAVTAILAKNPYLPAFWEQVSSQITRAVLYEVSATPKPGLVDRVSAGAHTDMDFYTFVDSATVFGSYIRKVLEHSAVYSGTAEALFTSIRPFGKQAEQAMFLATRGINTHKGAIFSLGVIAAAFARLFVEGKETHAKQVVTQVMAMTKHLIKEDLEHITEQNAATNGEKLYAKHGVLGIRGEVSAGFPIVMGQGLPALEHAKVLGWSNDDAMVYTLLSLMGELDDSNVVSRHNLYQLEQVKQIARDILAVTEKDPILLRKKAQELDAQFTAQNISPGGSADLLAVTLVLHTLENEISRMIEVLFLE